MIIENQFNGGAIQDNFDSRDYQYKDIIAGANIPFDWSVGFDVEQFLTKKITVKDQKSSYSCGGQAWSYLAEVLEALNTGSYEERSAKYIYAQTAVQGGGSTGRDNANIFVKQGVARESVLSSYPATEPNLTASVDITTSIRQDAKSNLSLSYAQVALDIDSIAQALSNEKGVILGISGMNNGTWTSVFPKPPTEVIWRHWVFACKAKMIDGVKHIGIINSWGETVGESGVQWLSEDYFNSGHIWSAYTHVIKPVIKNYFNTNLHQGSEGIDVTKLQKLLKQLGYFTYKDITGFYGKETKKAVLAFQYEQGIVMFGIESLFGHFCGQKTRKSLNEQVDLLS